MLLMRTCSRLAALTALCTLPATGAGAAVRPQANVGCAPILASGAGQDLGGGATEATIKVDGLTVGRTNASLTTTGLSDGVASFVGPLVFSSAAGTLTAQTTGSLTLASGDFTTTSTSLTGTGLLREITGQVTLVGQENLVTGSFTETITGRLCVPRR